MKKIIHIFGLIAFILFCTTILAVSLRGKAGNPTARDIATKEWKEDGPFELSPERGRFALMYSIVENKSYYFSHDIAQFAAPDVGFHNGKFVTLFAPLVSFLAIPGYMIGKFYGIGQVGAFATVVVFAMLNFLLIRAISIRLGAHQIAALIGGFVFLFATPAYAYAVTLYQHHFSTFLILISLWSLLKTKRSWALLVVFFACALSIPLDYPNLFFMFPIGLYGFGRVVSFAKIKDSFQLKIGLFNVLTPFIMILPMLFFFWFNNASYGNPLQLSGTVQTADFQKNNIAPDPLDLEKKVAKEETNKVQDEKSAVAFFNTRDILNGFYIHILSPDRGAFTYTPIMLLAILGLIVAVKKRVKMAPLLIAIIGANLLLYSMWGDPWGGWAFGSRYLIPTYALLSIFLSILLTDYRSKVLLLTIFVILLLYSLSVNTLGALTTSALPPKIQVLELEKISGSVQKYTPLRNWDLIIAGRSKSYVYNTYLQKYITAKEFYFAILFFLAMTVWLTLSYYVLSIPGTTKKL